MESRNYTPLGRRWRRAKGFRLSTGKFSVLRLRLRLLGFFGNLSRCLESLRRGVGCGGRSSGAGRRCSKSGSRRGLVREARHGGLRASGRSNSFYAEAIADCLEFIKRTSVSVDEGSAAAR